MNLTKEQKKWREAVRSKAVECGFGLKGEDEKGDPDLKGYVYEFARAVAAMEPYPKEEADPDPMRVLESLRNEYRVATTIARTAGLVGDDVEFSLAVEKLKDLGADGEDIHVHFGKTATLSIYPGQGEGNVLFLVDERPLDNMACFNEDEVFFGEGEGKVVLFLGTEWFIKFPPLDTLAVKTVDKALNGGCSFVEAGALSLWRVRNELAVRQGVSISLSAVDK